MRYITVAEFRAQAEQDAIKSAMVHRSVTAGEKPTPSYSLVVRLTWRDEEHLLVATHERTPREWSSFDRLVSFLEREGVKLTEMLIKFNQVE